MPKQPKKDLERLARLNKKILRYGAKLDTAKPEDSERRFTISYQLATDTMSVFERQDRNSGIVGGQFLKPTMAKKPDTQVTQKERDEAVAQNNPHKIFYYTPMDLFIGARVSLNGARFVILNMDKFTKHFVANDPVAFPWADPHTIAERIKEKALAHGSEFRKTFMEFSDHSDGVITRANLERLVNDYMPFDLTEQEMTTIMDYFDADGNGVIDYAEFRKAIFEDERSLEEIELSGGVKTSSFRQDLRHAQQKAAKRRGSVSVNEREVVEQYMGALAYQFGERKDLRDQLNAIFRRHDKRHRGEIDRIGFGLALREASKLDTQARAAADDRGSGTVYSPEVAETMCDYFFPQINGKKTYVLHYKVFLNLIWGKYEKLAQHGLMKKTSSRQVTKSAAALVDTHTKQSTASTTAGWRAEAKATVHEATKGKKAGTLLHKHHEDIYDASNYAKGAGQTKIEHLSAERQMQYLDADGDGQVDEKEMARFSKAMRAVYND